MEKEKYSKRLFDELFKKVEEELNNELKDLCINFKGLWAFSYLSGANKLQSVYFRHINDSLKSNQQYEKIFKNIESTSLDCDYGSLGDSLRSFNENPGKFSDFLPNTFDDPKGTVCYYDTVINQQHASFIIIKDEDKILGALDFFFEGNSIVEAKTKIEEYLNNNKKRLCDSSITAFKIQEHEYFLEIQKQENGDDSSAAKDNLPPAIEHIEKLLALSSKTPLMNINHKNGNTTSSLVCLNFDFIHSIIKHEHRFCPLTDDTKNCFHFNKVESFSGDRNTLGCTNKFLYNYYYKVFATLDAKRLYRQIKVDGIEYELGIVIRGDKEISLQEISVSKEIEELRYKPFNDLAKEKYRDERVFMNLEGQLNNIADVYAFSLSRLKPKIKCTINCNSGGTDCSVRNAGIGAKPLKQFISPSNILPIQHGTETKNGLFEKDGSQDSNIVHFQILKEEIFKEALKKLIIKYPGYFIEIIKPYVGNKEEKLYEQLNLKYAGDDPFNNNEYVEIIKGKLNLIEAILQEKESENLATRAAIAQVNARNNSHNIGAHVMNKLTTPQFLENFCSYANCLNSYKPDKDFETSDSENHKPFNQLAIFNNYVKCRMDYLADVALGTPLMQTNKYAYSDLFKELDKVRLLLEHISGLSDFKYKIEFKKNGQLLTEDNDLLVAIPNDILGMQAFYNILENIIRNTAKHSSNKPKLTVFTVNFIDEYSTERNGGTETEIKNILNEFIAVEINDNIPVEGDGTVATKDEKEEYREKMGKECKELEGFETRIDKLVFTQNWGLNKDILFENKLRSSSLGLIEMDASAAYLRKRDVSFINHRSYDIQYDDSWSRDTELNKENGKDALSLRGTNCRHFLKAFKTWQEVTTEFEKVENAVTQKNKIKGHALGYRFFLHRPAVVLAITNMQMQNTDELKKQGIWIKTPNDFKTYLSEGKVANHEFVIYTENGNGEFKISELIEKYKTSLPIRKLQVSEYDMTTFLSKEVLQKFESFCWEKWKEKNYNNPKVEIVTGYSHSATDKNFKAVFLDHLYDENGNVMSKDKVKKHWTGAEAAKYVEALSSLAQIKMPDYYKLTNTNNGRGEDSTKKFKNIYLKALDYESVFDLNQNVTTYQKLTEAILTKIIVIDERIQEAAENSDFMSVSYKELYKKMNVIVPEKSNNENTSHEDVINLSENSFETVKEKLENYIIKQIENSNIDKDYILIHYSILERMYSEKRVITDKLKEWANSINVVITSGRGIPEGLTAKVRFVNLSSVITAFIEIRSKWSISYLLHSTRKSNRV